MRVDAYMYMIGGRRGAVLWTRDEEEWNLLSSIRLVQYNTHLRIRRERTRELEREQSGA